MRRPKAIDLFSGCGGMTEGLTQAGFDVIGAVEIDPLAARTYAMNHRSVHVWNEDIRHLEAATLRRELRLEIGELDLVTGCPPCQGFSRMRTLNGGNANITDDRNDLVFDFLRMVDHFRPKAVLMENVPGLARDHRFELFCDELQSLGYVANHAVLNAADFAVPQRRERLIVLCGLETPIQFARNAKVKRTVRDAISTLPTAGRSGDPAHDLGETRSPAVARMISLIPKDGGSRSALSSEYTLPCHRRCDGFGDVYGRMAWDAVSPTITSGFVNPSKGRFLHPMQDRTITIREGALLQSFPHSYRFPIEAGKYPVAEMIGNAIPPEFIRRQATEVRRQATG
jgi:DNA (cytosine-5)-methyltransferase 1